MTISGVRFGQSLPRFQNKLVKTPPLIAENNLISTESLPSQPVMAARPLFGARKPNLTERAAQKLIKEYLKGRDAILEPYYEASWNMYCQGAMYRQTPDGPTNSDIVKGYKQKSIDYHNNPDMEARVNDLWKQRDRIASKRLLRQLEVLYKTFDGATRNVELRKSLGDLATDLEGKRAEKPQIYNGRKISELELTRLRCTETNPVELKKLWELNNSYGGYVIDEATGKTLAEGMLELFMGRNKLADLENEHAFGNDTLKYMDAYTRALRDRDTDEAELVRLTNDVEEATREPYKRLLSALDDISADVFGIPKEEARQSWFQSAYGKYTNMGNLKRLIDFDPDKYFEGLDVEDMLLRTAEMQGQRPEMQGLLDRSFYMRDGEKRSALYFDPERDTGKAQGAFATSGPNPPDTIKFFSSIEPSLKKGMYDGGKTALHESPGHNFDYAALSRRLAKLLRGHHLTTTESHAFLHEGLVIDREWLLKVPHDKQGKPLFDEKKADEYLAKAVPLLRLSELFGIRSTLAIQEFERLAYHHLYEEQSKQAEAKASGHNYPLDAKKLIQDLNQIWWQSRERFMLEKPPTGKDAEHSGWAWLPHYIGTTAYYPNYFQAHVLELLKSKHIKQKFGTLLCPEARQWLNSFLKDGTLYTWDSVVESLFGERLNARAVKEHYANVDIPQWQGKK